MLVAATLAAATAAFKRSRAFAPTSAVDLLGRFSPISPICLTFLGDFTPDRLGSGSLQTLWEWKNRVLLEEYYISDEAIPLQAESRKKTRAVAKVQ